MPQRRKPGEIIDFDDYSANYDELLHESTKLYAEDSEYFAKYKVDLIQQAARGPIKRVLEYGCGTGRNIVHLQRAFPGAEIVGSDVSAASLALAEKSNPGVRFEVERDDLDLGQFDLIFVASVFHHIPPAVRPGVMQTLAKRLSPAGSLDIFEHNPFNPVTRRIVSTCPFDADAILLKPAELRGLFKEAGVALEQQTYCLFVPPRLSWFLRFEKYLGWLPLGGPILGSGNAFLTGYLLRFATVGVLNTVVGYAVIFLCMYGFGQSPLLSNVLGYACGLVISFVLNRTYTFRSKAAAGPQAVRFAIFFALAYLVNLGVLMLLTRLWGVGDGISQIIAGIAYFGVFFILSKLFVFEVEKSIS